MRTSIILSLLLVVACGVDSHPLPTGEPPVTYTMVPRPNDSLAGADVFIETDGSKIVQAHGSFALTHGSVPGQNYTISRAHCGTQISAVMDAYLAGPMLSVSHQPTIDDFSLMAGTPVPAARCLIVANCVQPICSYQQFAYGVP